MGNQTAKAALIIEDLRSSWYFRFWAFSWLFCAVIVFAALIILGKRSTEESQEESWKMSIESADAITYPNFLFQTSVDELQNSIEYIACSFNGSAVPCTSCGNGVPMSKCVSIEASNFQATIESNLLSCKINITSPNNSNKLLGFRTLPYGDSIGLYDTWIHPDNNAWILLTKSTTQSEGQSESDIWDIRLLYHTTVVENNFFEVSVRMDQFSVYHYFQENTYDRWLSVADIGGFAYFMYMMHTIFMWLIGTFLENDSKYLHGDNYARIQG